ncbi:hypothetical protein BJ085DRAFT_39516 [Dimargaris cristalligena]|uniref:Zn(2)-C6 fungal-type domain-containing protein n=1 Tax=Dimargaris cristalligena TaxID=215637 RepID=A0A4Q0A2C4_9FUNG|nr:hypothetical protein BJ085DRAFT_39516 [Dimargaris cristalligena]|eukprot:RKP40255.1 hypothetical protein BJ085DRAFT_39516 [Dimargaris cristalligena]
MISACSTAVSNSADLSVPSEVKLRRVCDHCSARRFRCNGKNPCGSCTRRLYNCHYSPFAKRKPRLVPPTKNNAQAGFHSFVLANPPSPPSPAPTKPKDSVRIQTKRRLRFQQPRTPSSVPWYPGGAPDSAANTMGPQLRVFAERLETTLRNLYTADLPAFSVSSPAFDPGHLTPSELACLHNSIPPSIPCTEDVFYHPGLIYPLVQHFFDSFARFRPYWQKQRFFNHLAANQVPRSLLSSMVAYSAQLYPCQENYRHFIETCIAEHTHRAEQLVAQELETANMDTITSALLLCLIACNYCEVEKMDIYGSLAIRLCFYLNLHSVDAPAPSPTGMSVADAKSERLWRELKRRTAWSIFFICSIARLLGKVTYGLDLDLVSIDTADDKVLISLLFLTTAADGPPTYPLVIWPLFNKSFGTASCNSLVRIANRLTYHRRRCQLGHPVSMTRICEINQALKIWRSDLPEYCQLDLVPTRTRYVKTTPLVLNGLVHFLHYLCYFYNNSTLLLAPVRATHPIEVYHCEELATEAFQNMCQELIVPMAAVPIALRPLNCFFYGYFGFQACLLNSADGAAFNVPRQLKLLDHVYVLLSDFFPHSKFSQALAESLGSLLTKYNLRWDPPSANMEELDVEEGENCEAENP